VIVDGNCRGGDRSDKARDVANLHLAAREFAKRPLEIGSYSQAPLRWQLMSAQTRISALGGCTR